MISLRDIKNAIYLSRTNSGTVDLALLGTELEKRKSENSAKSENSDKTEIQRNMKKSLNFSNSEIRLNMYEKQLKRNEKNEREFGTGLRRTGPPDPTWGYGMHARQGLAPPNKSGPQSAKKTPPRRSLCIMRDHEVEMKLDHPARKTMCHLGKI